MCKFCVEHGDGRRWYLEASNYAADLESDLRRRGYIVDFLRDFDRNRRRVLTGCEVAEALPKVVGDPLKRYFAKRMERSHFGQPVPIEECHEILGMATSIVNIPCPCRTFAGRGEQGYCLVVTTTPVDGLLAEGLAGYEGGPDLSGFEHLSREQAMDLLRRCESEGLMHSVWTFVTPWIGAICNCDLESGCMAMTLSVAHGAKVMWKGEYAAVLDESACTGCGACAQRCPFGAIGTSRGGAPARLRAEDCWGCGVCRSACRTGAIALRERTAVPAAAGLW